MARARTWAARVRAAVLRRMPAAAALARVAVGATTQWDLAEARLAEARLAEARLAEARAGRARFTRSS